MYVLVSHLVNEQQIEVQMFIVCPVGFVYVNLRVSNRLNHICHRLTHTHTNIYFQVITIVRMLKL